MPGCSRTPVGRFGKLRTDTPLFYYLLNRLSQRCFGMSVFETFRLPITLFFFFFFGVELFRTPIVGGFGEKKSKSLIFGSRVYGRFAARCDVIKIFLKIERTFLSNDKCIWVQKMYVSNRQISLRSLLDMLGSFWIKIPCFFIIISFLFTRTRAI